MFTMQSHPDIDTAVRYLQAVSRFASGEELASFFHKEVVVREMPNLFSPTGGAIRDLAALDAAAEAGRRNISEQNFHVINALAADGWVALEATWTGRLAVPLGGLPAGKVLRAHIAVFLEFRDGLICTQRNYDCYEPPGSSSTASP